MTDRELKQYILVHHEDSSAFHAYLDRRHARPDRTTIQIDDPDWEKKYYQQCDRNFMLSKLNLVDLSLVSIDLLKSAKCLCCPTYPDRENQTEMLARRCGWRIDSTISSQ